MQVSYTFCCDFIALLMKSAGSTSCDEFGPTEVVVQGLKKVSRRVYTFSTKGVFNGGGWRLQSPALKVEKVNEKSRRE